jgi:predicted nucleic acid-binding protein
MLNRPYGGDKLGHGSPVWTIFAESVRMNSCIRARLEAEGRRLDEPDLRIASIALSRRLTFVTGNVRYFARVADLLVENWLEA